MCDNYLQNAPCNLGSGKTLWVSPLLHIGVFYSEPEYL